MEALDVGDGEAACVGFDAGDPDDTAWCVAWIRSVREEGAEVVG